MIKNFVKRFGPSIVFFLQGVKGGGWGARLRVYKYGGRPEIIIINNSFKT